MITKFFGTIASVGVMMALGVRSALAGPVVIDGTDANDHGSGTSTTNSDGWNAEGFSTFQPSAIQAVT